MGGSITPEQLSEAREQDWYVFLHSLPIWERRLVYKDELQLHDRYVRGFITIEDVLGEVTTASND